jgi:hypothetical protein
MDLQIKTIYNVRNLILIFLSLFILTVTCSKKEHNGDYTSTEESEYYKTKSYKGFQPARLSFIDSLVYDFLTIKESPVTNSFNSVWDGTAYDKFYDSLMRTCKGRNCMDSLMAVQFNDKVANIYRYSILRYDSLGSLKIILFTDSKLENRERGYWLAISNDFGKSWKRYYPGLVKSNFYFIKPIPKVPFFKTPSTVQLEFALVRKIQQETLPVGPAEYELLQDNLLMEINIPILTKDSDKDGLTDVMESKLFLNPYQRDTDEDGIEDSADKNPRFENQQNKHSLLYNYLLEHAGMGDSTFIAFDNPNLDQREPAYRDTVSHTYLIVTDDRNLLHVDGTRNRYILMTREEYQAYAKRNYISVGRLYVSPLFQVDNDSDYMKIHVSRDISGSDYLIIERDNGWIVKYIGGYII